MTCRVPEAASKVIDCETFVLYALPYGEFASGLLSAMYGAGITKTGSADSEP